MSRPVFDNLHDIIKHKITLSNTNFRDCIDSRERLGIFLYKLGHSISNRSIEHLFGVGESTVRKIQ
jgi:hypothetical protein